MDSHENLTDAAKIMAGIDRHFACLPTAEQAAARLRLAHSQLPTMYEALLSFQAAFRDRNPEH